VQRGADGGGVSATVVCGPAGWQRVKGCRGRRRTVHHEATGAARGAVNGGEVGEKRQPRLGQVTGTVTHAGRLQRRTPGSRIRTGRGGRGTLSRAGRRPGRNQHRARPGEDRSRTDPGLPCGQGSGRRRPGDPGAGTLTPHRRCHLPRCGMSARPADEGVDESPANPPPANSAAAERRNQPRRAEVDIAIRTVPPSVSRDRTPDRAQMPVGCTAACRPSPRGNRCSRMR